MKQVIYKSFYISYFKVVTNFAVNFNKLINYVTIMTGSLYSLLVVDLANRYMGLAKMVLNYNDKTETQRLMAQARKILNFNRKNTDYLPPFYGYGDSGREQELEWVKMVRRYNTRVKAYRRLGLNVCPITLPFPYS